MNRLKRIIDYYRRRRPATLLWHHGLLFAAVAALMIAARLTWLPWLPLFWPLIIWYAVFSLHFLLLRSFSADEEWADERADKLRRKAYDFQHVKDIYIKPITLKTPYLPPRKPDQSE